MITPSSQKLEQLNLMLDRGRAENGTPHGLVLERAQKWILHFNTEHVHGPEEVGYEADELVVVCPVRDSRPYIKSFVEHYLSLGVKHLFFLDNGSTDGTVEALKGYENVTVLQTGLPYRNPKRGGGGTEALFKQYLVERFGKKGRWCLCADIDELFDYPYSDVVRFDSLLGYLNANSYTAVAAQMLDMFPEEPLSSQASNPLDEPLKERHRFYDISNIRRVNIKELPRLRNNTLESDDIEFFYGGIRNTLFPSKYTNDLTKFPLVFSDDRIKPMDESSHWADNARVADFTCVLLHYKFLDGYFHQQATQAVREGQYSNNSVLYKRSLEVLERNPILQVKRETARELRSINELVENQFLVVSEEYMMLVYEQARKNGTGHALRQGEPDGLEDPAFDRTRARAKVQSLRAKRLEQRLQDFTEQHERELEKRLEKLRENNRKAKKRAVEKVREQNKRKLDKLNSRLARTKNKSRKKNRNLARQLQSIRASKGWRLLNKLG